MLPRVDASTSVARYSTARFYRASYVARSRNANTASANLSGCSMCGAWPDCGIVSIRASHSASASTLEMSVPVTRSSSPHKMSAG